MNEAVSQLKSLYVLYQSGDSFNAEVGVREILEKDPLNVGALQLGALTALGINQLVTAHQRVDAAIAQTVMTAELASIQGRILKESGEWAAAEEAYDLAESLDPELDRVKFNRLSLLIVSEQPKRVLEELKSGFGFGDVGIWARSIALTDLGQYQAALTALRDLKSEAYADKKLFQSIKCYAGLERLDAMAASFASLPLMSKLYPKALNIVVNNYQMRGLHEHALRALADVPQESSVEVAVAVIKLWRALGETQKAEEKIEQTEKIHPKNTSLLCEVADLAGSEGRFSESCEIYKTALANQPGDFTTMVGFAKSAIADNRFAEAQTLLQSALAQAPNNQLLLALVATLLRKMGRNHSHLYDFQGLVKVYDLEPPVGYHQISDLNAALKTRLDELHIYKSAPINQTLRMGSQTETDLALSDDPVLMSFFDAVDAPIRDYMSQLDWDDKHPLRRRARNDYRISGAWSIRLSEHGHHVNHVHPMGWLSSVYYVEVPPSVSANNHDGWLKFGEPDMDIGLEAEHFVQPKGGRLVLFPSYMWHGTIPFKGQETRLTLPFDVVPA